MSAPLKECSVYASLIIEHAGLRIDSEKPFGLLESHGPTGIGKTHAFISRGGVIDFLHGRRIPVIFCCDRWALLEEAGININKNQNPNIKSVLVRSNKHAVEEACKVYCSKDYEKQRDKIAWLLTKYYRGFSDNKRHDGAIAATRKKLEDKIKDAQKEIEIQKMGGEDVGSSKINYLIKFLNFNKGRDIAFDDMATANGRRKRITDAIRELAKNRFYKSVFPACQWFLDPLNTVLVTTTHKFVMGFDIGPLHTSAVTLSLLEKDYMAKSGANAYKSAAIIFDEFEAQEQAMLSALAGQASYINNPFEVQKVLYDGADCWSSQKGEGVLIDDAKEFLKKFPEPIPSRLVAGNGWNLKEDTKEVAPAYTFRSGNVISASTTLLVEKGGKDLIVHRGAGRHLELFAGIIGEVGRRNRFWLKKASEFLENNNPEIHSYLVNLFDKPGGGKTPHGRAFNDPNKILSFRRAKNKSAIKPEERMTRAESHLTGYDFMGLVPMPSGGGLPAPDLDIKHYAMETTPESLLVGLAVERFVFGLSATTCLRRVCNHFDMGWVSAFLASRDALIAEDEVLREGIGEIIADETSGSVCHFVRTPCAVEFETKNWPSDLGGFKKDRFSAIWSAVIMASNEGHGCSDTATWLVFTNTYRHVRLALEAVALNQHHDYIIVGKSVCERLKMEVRPILTPCMAKDEHANANDEHVYLLSFKDPSMKPVLLFFLDAAAYKRAKDFQSRLDWLKDEASRVKADLFVLTFYASSERGVNLLFSGKDGPQEFNSVCLIDLPYYHLSTDQNDIRANLRRIQKFTEKGVTSRDHQEIAFRDLIFNEKTSASVNSFQSVHKKTIDHQMASFASAIQATGRGVRDWKKSSAKTFYVSEKLVTYQLKNLAGDMRLEACLPLLGPVGNGFYACINAYAAEIAPEIQKNKQVNKNIEEDLKYFARTCLGQYRNLAKGLRRCS